MNLMILEINQYIQLPNLVVLDVLDYYMNGEPKYVPWGKFYLVTDRVSTRNLGFQRAMEKWD